MKRPEVSVLMPAYNALATLPEAVDSVRTQEGVDWELVIVDDGSDDGSDAWLAALAAEEPRVQVVSRPHGGVVAAHGAGLAACRAPLVARMDADDISLPGRLANQVAYLDAHPEVDAVGCLIRCFPDAVVQEGMRRYEAWQNSLLTHEDICREMFVEAPLVHPSVTLRAAAISQVGGYRDEGWPEDYALWLRLYEAGCRFAKLPEHLFLWRDHERRLTRSNPDYALDRHQALKAHFLARTLLRDHEALQIWGAGPTGRRLRRLLEREGRRTVRFFDIDPRRFRDGADGSTPIRPWQEIVEHREHPTLVAVAARGAREQIREAVRALPVEEGEHFWFVS